MIWTDCSQDTQRQLARLASDEFDAGQPDLRWIGKVRAFFRDLFARPDADHPAETPYDPILLMPDISCTGSFVAFEFLTRAGVDGEREK